MRARHLILLCSILFISLMVVFGCGFGVTVQQRVDFFLAALNLEDRTDLHLNLDPSVENYDLLKAPEYWGVNNTDGWFPTVSGDTPYTLANTLIDDTTNPDVPVFTGDLSGPAGYGAAKYLEMTFVKVGLNWMIETITLGLDSVVPYNP
jgi:hypothetical protein